MALHMSAFDSSSTVRDGLKGLRRDSDAVTELFFHPHNVRSLQTSIRYAVYQETGKVIDTQPEQELLTVMRKVLSEQGYDPGASDPAGEVRELNRSVVRVASHNVAQAVRSHLFYLADIQNPVPVPISRGKLATSRHGESVVFPNFVTPGAGNSW